MKKIVSFVMSLLLMLSLLPVGAAANPTCTQRLRTHSSAMFVALRRLHEAPTPR